MKFIKTLPFIFVFFVLGATILSAVDGLVTVTVTSGAITTTSCVIPSGSHSCNTSLTWNVSNPTSSSSVYLYKQYSTGTFSTANDPTVATGTSGSTTYPIVSGVNNFYLKDNGTYIDPSVTSASASCASYSNWNGSICAPVTYTLYINKGGNGGGSVTAAGTYNYGTAVTATASADGSSTFSGWSGGGCSGTGNCSVTMTSDITITANFAARTNITSLYVSPSTIPYGGTANIYYACSNGYYSHLIVDDVWDWQDSNYYGSRSPSTIPSSAGVMNTPGSHYAMAYCYNSDWVPSYNSWLRIGTFDVVPPAPTNLSQSCSANGRSATMSWTQTGVSLSYFRIVDDTTGAQLPYSVPENVADTGPSITIPTTPGHSYHYWVHGRLSSDNNNGPASGASFSCNPTITLTTPKGGNGGGTVTGAGTYDYGTSVSLTATPDGNSTFSGWSGGGCSGTGSCSVTLTSNTTITANFARVAVVTGLSVSPNPINLGGTTNISFTSNYGYYCHILVDWDWNYNYTGYFSSATYTLSSIPPLTVGDHTAAAICYNSDWIIVGGWTAMNFTVLQPVNGVCSASHYGCNAGNSANNAVNSPNWTWSCNGINGGSNASCSEYIPIPTNHVSSCSTNGRSATITWTLPAVTSLSYFRVTDDTTGAQLPYSIPENVSDTGPSTTIPTTPGHSYHDWIHTRLPNGNSDSSISYFSCNPTSNLTIVSPGGISGTYSAPGTYAVDYNGSVTITAAGWAGYTASISGGCSATGSYQANVSCTVSNMTSAKTVTVTYTDPTPPTAPGIMTTGWTRDHYVNTNFTASTTGSTDSGSGIRGYRLCRSPDNTGGCYYWTAAGEHASMSEVVSGSDLPSDGTFRYYYWYAFDNSGNQSTNSAGEYIRMDQTAPTYNSTSFTGCNYLNGNNCYVKNGTTFYVNISHTDNGVGSNQQYFELSKNGTNRGTWDGGTGNIKSSANPYGAANGSNYSNYGEGGGMEGTGYLDIQIPQCIQSGDCNNTATGRWPVTAGGGASNMYGVTVYMYDGFWNGQGYTDTGKYVYLDNDAPSVPTPTDAGASTNSTSLTFSASPSDSSSGIASCYAQIGNGTTNVMDTTSVGSGTSYTWSGGTIGGTYFYRYYCTDNVGNSSGWSNWSDGIVINAYTVSTSAGANGSISPTSATVGYGATTSFTITPNSNYAINTVTGCGGTLSGSTYTTGAITSSCTVTATFSSVYCLSGPSGYTKCADESGTCSFSGNAYVAYGCNSTFNYKGANTSTACNNTNFGDPLPGYLKACFYRTITGTLAPSSSSSCVIAAGASTCNVGLTWTTTNPISTSAVTASGMTNVDANNGSQAFTVPYNSRTFYLYNSAILLAQTTITSSCDVGTTWDGSKCALPTNGGWSAWSTPSSSCGITDVQTRSCNNPSPANGGTQCTKNDLSLGLTDSQSYTTAPCPPVISGPTSFYAGVLTNFGFTATNSNAHQIEYGIDWNGDTVADVWIPAGMVYSASGFTQFFSQSWGIGTYTFKALSQDKITGVNSTWTPYTVTVTALPPAPVVTVTATPSTVPYNGKSLIKWSSTNSSSSCIVIPNAGLVGANQTDPNNQVGLQTPSLTARTIYQVSCTGPGGTSVGTAEVKVSQIKSTFKEI